MLTRRQFLAATTATLAARALPAQSAMASVAAMEHDHIFTEVATLPTPKTLIDFSFCIATLTAAFVLTKDTTHAAKAEALLTDWLLQPRIDIHKPVVDLLPLAEVAVALRFQQDTLPAAKLTAVNGFFSTLQDFLNADPQATLARDRKDHRASAWLLLASSIAHSQRTDNPLGSKALDACRLLFRKPTLRNQITADGTFPQELASDNPFRNTLFNFDLLAASCQLLSSPFDDLWNYELQDGPGMRAVAAWIAPVIQFPEKWPTVADAHLFRELPLRRPGLLFAGRAFNRPEYVSLFRGEPTTINPELAASLPIRQPLLWTTRAPHGL